MTTSSPQPQSTGRTDDLQPPVIFVPGGVLPAAAAYGSLLEALGPNIRPVLKDLEVYAAEAPPPHYGLDLEVAGLAQAADRAGFDTFHLVGYSGGGAVSLAFAAKYPARLRSLALVEPAWIGSDDWTPTEVAYWKEVDRVMALPPDERMRAFVRAGLRPGVEPPPMPPGPPPPWMAKRPAGLQAMVRAFKSYHLDRARFREFPKPVYLAIGGLSHPIEAIKAEILAGLFPNIQVEIYEDRHHFDPPHRAEPERFARALRELWQT
ncbi:MAG: alpha/beta hydrolase [Chloroflexi bacterium]|nr:alpha/beta hydrolase [Chloroflexota bacterium]